MAAIALDKAKLHPTNWGGKSIEDTSMKTSLRQGMDYGTPLAPEMASGRPAGSRPVVCFSTALACMKLIARSEVASAKFVGLDGQSEPIGVNTKTTDKGFELWTVLRKSADGLKGTLQLRGSQFGTGMFSFYGGIAIASYMLMNYNSYKSFADSVERAILANTSGNTDDRDKELAKMSDELAFAIENMLDGVDPTGITEIELEQIVPTDLTQDFAGGEFLAGAFTTKAGLDKLRNTPVRAMTTATVLMGNERIETDYVGDLPYELRDYFLRGWHVLMTGPTSTGKTKVSNAVFRHLKAPISRIKGTAGLEDRDLIGCWVRDSGGGWVYSYGPLSEAIINARKQYELQLTENDKAKQEGRKPGKVPPAFLHVDEINRLDERHQNVFIGVMDETPDENGDPVHMLRVPETNEILSCPVGRLVVVGARNYGGGYVGTNDMDQALVRRFHVKLDLSYLPSADEIKLVVSRTGIDKKLAKVLVRAAADTRTHQRAQLKAPMDTDTIIKWAAQLKYLADNKVAITDKIVHEVARKIAFEICVDRSEDSGDFDAGGDTVLTDNITDAWKEVMKP